MLRLICLLATVLFVNSLMGQSSLSEETQSYVSQPQGTYVLQNLTLLDGTGGAAQTNQDIIIDGDMIIAVGEDLAVPDGATYSYAIDEIKIFRYGLPSHTSTTKQKYNSFYPYKISTAPT